MNDSERAEYYGRATNNKKEIHETPSNIASCFHCVFRFDSGLINEWVDGGTTAVCPGCDVPSVISGEVSKHILQELHDNWFSAPSAPPTEAERFVEKLSTAYKKFSDKFEMIEGKTDMKKSLTYNFVENERPLSEIQKLVYENSKTKGFWTQERSNLYEKLALVTTEVSEAVEELRAGVDPLEVRFVDGKPEGVGPELADVIIRVLDLAEHLGIDMGKMVAIKHRHNLSRPFMNGGKQA